jgi:ribosome biogenesis protein ERB1
MGVTPYKKMQYHERGVNKVTFHHHFPLFASSSDDGTSIYKFIKNKTLNPTISYFLGTINIFHGKVSNDLAQSALIVPLKVLK